MHDIFTRFRQTLNKANLEIVDYQLGLESVEAQLIVHQKNEVSYEEKIAVLELEVKDKGNAITRLTNQLDQTLKEKEDLKAKLEKFEISSKNLNKLINSQLSAKDKTGLGYGDQLSESDSEVLPSVFDSQLSDGDDNPTNNRFKKGDGYHVVPPPLTRNYMPPLADLSFAGLDDSVYRPTTNKANWVSDDEDTLVDTQVDSQTTVKPIFKKIEFTKARKESDKQANTPKMVTQNSKADRKAWNGNLTQKPRISKETDSTVEGNRVTAVKTSACYAWRPKITNLNNVSKDSSGSWISKRVKLIDPQGRLKMGYEKPSDKLTFYKAFFSPQWKFLIYTILQCLSAKTTSWNEFNSTMASIEKLESKVERLEEENKVLKEFKGVHYIVDSDEPVMEKEESSKHGRKIAEKVLSMLDVNDEEPVGVDEVLEVVTAAKLINEVVTTAGVDVNAASVQDTPITAAEATKVIVEVPKPRKRRGVIIQDPKETTTTVTVQPKNMAGYKMNYFKGMSYDEIRPLFEKHYNYNQAFLNEVNEGIKVLEKEVRQEKEVKVESSKREGKSLEQEIEKKQNMEQETEELKKHLQIVPDNNDNVYADATPLASKIPIVDY
nr:ribonuclease H-like domain-containing protein [Tanacetum cinerariifolium]